MKIELQRFCIRLIRHEFLNITENILEVKADIFPPKMAQLYGLPILHVIKFENYRFKL
jgi:hypothetical protein